MTEEIAIPQAVAEKYGYHPAHYSSGPRETESIRGLPPGRQVFLVAGGFSVLPVVSRGIEGTVVDTKTVGRTVQLGEGEVYSWVKGTIVGVADSDGEPLSCIWVGVEEIGLADKEDNRGAYLLPLADDPGVKIIDLGRENPHFLRDA